MNPVSTPHAPAAIGPYSQGMTYGDLVFTSGQIPLDPESGVLKNTDIRTATHQVMANLAAVLKSGGSDLHHVLKMTVFLNDMKDFAAFNEAYASHLTAPFPARSCVQVAALPKDSLVEIEAIAIKKV
jgi:2-iminobutanoate/2-iminopropanoate deaminase